jgi:hypothetical protein
MKRSMDGGRDSPPRTMRRRPVICDVRSVAGEESASSSPLPFAASLPRSRSPSSYDACSLPHQPPERAEPSANDLNMPLPVELHLSIAGSGSRRCEVAMNPHPSQFAMNPSSGSTVPTRAKGGGSPARSRRAPPAEPLPRRGLGGFAAREERERRGSGRRRC